MNKRIKKKKGKVLDSELWNFDVTICDWIVPRLKRFKQINCACPGKAPMDTPEAWDEALDKMIRGFELLRDDLVDKYYYVGCSLDNVMAKAERDRIEAKEGLQLFVDWFESLWI